MVFGQLFICATFKMNGNCQRYKVAIQTLGNSKATVILLLHLNHDFTGIQEIPTCLKIHFSPISPRTTMRSFILAMGIKCASRVCKHWATSSWKAIKNRRHRDMLEHSGLREAFCHIRVQIAQRGDTRQQPKSANEHLQGFPKAPVPAGYLPPIDFTAPPPPFCRVQLRTFFLLSLCLLRM